MITENNFKELLIHLGFEEKKQAFEKHFPQTDAFLKVDFHKKELIYPEVLGLTVHKRQTCNFVAPENFVVFECVHRLLEKGYQPRHIELEPEWKVGHSASGGRADILVRNQEGKPLLLIECKTAGKEFERAWKYMLQDGGQLFSYAQQIQETEFLCLYASDFDEKTSQLSLEHKIVSHKDNEKILAEDSKLKSFENAKDIKERYKVWKDTYKLEYTEIGIFEENIPAYTIGKENYTLADLRIVAEKDIQKKYHEFATILRQYNISGRENAFDKLVNLFLAKIVDEKHNGHDLQFRWKGIASDNYFDFIDRLEKLYSNGMQEFLKEEVTFVEKQTVIDAFKFFRNDPCATRETVLGHFKRQKYFTNNDFSFIDVHNEKLFYHNFVVLRQMVQMIENIQLNGDQQNQFLGDLFEGFLDKGVKQSEGQFFTPMPIVKFILMALPLEEIVKNSTKIPKAIDYACGAGHFLTELAAQLQHLVAKHKAELNPKDYYRNLYGIEKEYRLSKVAKVSAFMYSQDDIQVFYADALVKHNEIRDSSFDILVANPPFAVKGFLETLDEEEQNQFSLTKHINDLVKNNAIQCFFLERAKQLLKVDGMAGIIVPTSVLSNSDTTHIATREMLLQFFDIIALAEFGSRTFGKTGTNTVVLFLRKKDNNPPPHTHYKERVDSWFSDNDTDKQRIFEDKYFIAKYCQYLDIKTDDYLPLLTAFDDTTVIAKLLQHEMFKEYQNAFQKNKDKLNETHQKQVHRLEKELKNKLSKEKPALSAAAINEKINADIKDLQAKHAKEIERAFIKYLQNIEKDKLYYFVLASTNPQKVLVIKSPTDNAEQKKFLGYEWSGSKGNEGIKYLGATAHSKADTKDADAEDDDSRIMKNLQAKRIINTPLFDNNDPQNPDKIAYYVQRNFILEKKYYIDEKNKKVRDYLNERTEPLTLPQHLQAIASYVSLTDLLDFSRKDFDKALSLTPKKTNAIETKWELVKLGEVVEIRKGKSITQKDTKEGNIKVVAGGIDFAYLHNEANRPANTITISASGANAGFVNFWREAIFASDCTTILGKTLTETLYFFNILKHYLQDEIFSLARGAAQPHVYPDDIANIKIPLPPLHIQQQIVAECEAIDHAAETAKTAIEKAKGEIEERVKSILNNTKEELKLGQLAETSSGGTPLSSKNEYYQGGTIPWINSGEIGQGEIWKPKNFITELGLQNSSAKIFPKNTVLLAMYGATAGKVGILKIEACTNQAVCGIFPNEKYLPKFLYLQLFTMYDYLLSLRTGVARDNLSQSKIQEIKIKLPPLAIQEQIVSEVEALEKVIQESEAIIQGATAQKQEVLRRYL